MNYEVVWLPLAEERIAAVWLGSGDRNGVTRAVNHIERGLARSPSDMGEPLFDTVRTVAYGGVGLEYEVIEDARRVVVISAWAAEFGPPEPSDN